MKKLMSFLLVLCMVASVSAATYDWDNGDADRDFSNAANWSPDRTTPLSSDLLRIDMTGNDSPIISSSANTAANYMYIGVGGNGELTINGGTASFASGIATAYNAGYTGSITMTDATLISGGYFTHGKSAAAVLTMQGSSSLSMNRSKIGVTADASGSIYMSGTSSIDCETYFTVGTAGDGVVSMTDNSTLTSNRSKLGSDAGSTGSVSLTGSASIEIEDYFTVGSSGSGTLSISGNASVSADHITMVVGSSGSGLIELSDNATLSLVDYLNIGSAGAAEVVVTGSDTTVELGGDLTLGESSELEFILNGALGVGSGIVADANVVLSGMIEASFMDTVVNGTYTVLTAGGEMTDESTSGLLSQDMINSGWSYDIVTLGEGESQVQELQLTIPEPTTVLLLSFGALGFLRRSR